VEFFKKPTSFPFMATRKVWYGLSIALMLISFVSFATRGLNLAIDFTGGVSAEVQKLQRRLAATKQAIADTQNGRDLGRHRDQLETIVEKAKLQKELIDRLKVEAPESSLLKNAKREHKDQKAEIHRETKVLKVRQIMESDPKKAGAAIKAHLGVH